MQIHLATPDDFRRILEINDESVKYLSVLDMLSLSQLHADAAYHRVLRVDGQIQAFLIALREGSSYSSLNYRWFANKYSRFLYVDRIVVSKSFQRRGAGKFLYADLMEFAVDSEAPCITCEFDIVPPNHMSRIFHQHHGFQTVATQEIALDKKVVALQVFDLATHSKTPRHFRKGAW
ncbi:GNAT family N-acetyltransferase [Oxalobacteraceae bacterium CAVE-383]|nr:GNAT family N-acetyltransferase [Oxalobacteraceae bacterium CAVE-383]